jgi:hypothetical protein
VIATERIDAQHDLDIFDIDGHAVRLGRLWESQPVVLVLVRHFG